MISTITNLLLYSMLLTNVSATNEIMNEKMSSDNQEAYYISTEVNTYEGGYSENAQEYLYRHNINIEISVPSNVFYDDYLMYIIPESKGELYYDMDSEKRIYNIDSSYSYHKNTVKSLIPGGIEKVLEDSDYYQNNENVSFSTKSHSPYVIYSNIPEHSQRKIGEKGRREEYIYTNVSQVKLKANLNIYSPDKCLRSLGVALFKAQKDLEIKMDGISVSYVDKHIKIDMSVKLEKQLKYWYYIKNIGNTSDI